MSKSKFLLNELTFGAEVECFFVYEKRYDIKTLAENLYFRFSTDGSIRADEGATYYTAELISKVYPYTKEGLIEFKNSMTKLCDAGIKMNASCGGHIHIGVKPYTDKMSMVEKQAFVTLSIENFAAIEDSIYALNGGPKRAKGEYAKAVKGMIAQMQNNSRSGDLIMPSPLDYGRYYGLNLTAWAEHNTFEFRIFEGKSDPEIWVNNVELAAKFIHKTANNHKFSTMSYANWDMLESMFKIDLSHYVAWRMVMRTPDTARKLKETRQKQGFYTAAHIKAWKMLSKLIAYEVDNLETTEKFYLKLRKLFASSTANVILSEHNMFIQTEGTVWKVQISSYGITVEDTEGQKRSYSLSFSTPYTLPTSFI